jgi:hypothetical protein
LFSVTHSVARTNEIKGKEDEKPRKGHKGTKGTKERKGRRDGGRYKRSHYPLNFNGPFLVAIA